MAQGLTSTCKRRLRLTILNFPMLSPSVVWPVSLTRLASIQTTGFGRFLQDLRSASSASDLPIHFFVPGKGSDDSDVRFIRAPSFSVPGYPDLKISMPLEHQRKQISHELQKIKPSVIHVSTPGPFGCLGISLAKEFRLPLVGIYHTDFPGYAASIVTSQLAHYQSNPAKLLEHPYCSGDLTIGDR